MSETRNTPARFQVSSRYSTVFGQDVYFVRDTRTGDKLTREYRRLTQRLIDFAVARNGDSDY